MVLLHEEQVLLESLDLYLWLQPSDIGVISDLSEPIDVALYRLTQGHPHLILDSEVIISKMGIDSPQDDVGIVHRTCKDLSPQVLEDLEVMSPVSDLGFLLLQVFPDFALQSLIISP